MKRVPIQGPFVVYTGAWDVKPAGAEVLASRRAPYFNRRFDHFCSHQHTPDAEDSPYPAATCNGSVVYFAHKLFTNYRQLGQPLYRDMVEDAIEVLVGQPAVATSLPTGARLTLTKQPAESRYVLHLLFAALSKRGADAAGSARHIRPIELIEDEIPLANVKCEVATDETVKSVTLAPAGDALPFEQSRGSVSFEVPELRTHQMVELAY